MAMALQIRAGQCRMTRDISKLRIRFETDLRLRCSIAGNHIISGFGTRVVLMAEYL